MEIESTVEINTINNYLVKLHNIEKPVRCRIIETKNTELPYNCEIEFLSNYESIAIPARTYGEAFGEMCLFLAELKTPLQENKGY